MAPDFNAKLLITRLAIRHCGKIQTAIFLQLLFFGSVSILYVQRLTLRKIFLTHKHTKPSPVKPIIAYYNSENVLQACSLPNVCIKMHYENRELHLPAIYRSQRTLIRRCQNFLTQPGFPKSLLYKLQFYDADNTMLPTSEQHPIDVLGPPLHSEFYKHFAHFVVDFTDSVMVPMSFFATKGNNYSLTATCTAPDGASMACDAQPLNPRFAVSALNTRKGTWTRKFMDYIADATHQPLLYYLPPVKPRTPACFRSLITNAVKYDIDYPERDALLRSTGVVRQSARPRCAPHIIVVSRKPKAARAIPQKLLVDLRTALRAELTRTNHSATFEFVQDLSRLTFAGQVALMQRADVLVTAHGAELSNLIFLRRGTTVLEIYPFGWLLRLCFRRMLDSVHARRVELLSPPDPERFESCMQRAGRPKSESDVFKKYARMYYETHDEAKRFHLAPKFWALPTGMWACFPYQRTVFDPVQLARRIVRESRRRCKE